MNMPPRKDQTQHIECVNPVLCPIEELIRSMSTDVREIRATLPVLGERIAKLESFKTEIIARGSEKLALWVAVAAAIVGPIATIIITKVLK